MNPRYNDDLLIAPEVQGQAKKDFPAVFYVLNFPELRNWFERVDLSANAAKRRSQAAGIGAVVLAVSALIGASSEPLWHSLKPQVPEIIALASALIGLIAVVLAGSGLLYGKRKRVWLNQRMLSERLRQFHFQLFMAHLGAIANTFQNDGVRLEFERRRRSWLQRFRIGFEGHEDEWFTRMTDRLEIVDWHFDYDGEGATPQLTETNELREAFEAYDELRFGVQEGYATHKLQRVPRRGALHVQPLLVQKQVLSGSWLIAVALLVLVHCVVVVCYFADVQLLQSPWLHVAIIWCALIALGARTIDEGLSLPREIERYEDYLCAVKELRRRFKAVANPADKLEVMREMERLAFDEMRSFIRSSAESSFVL